MPDAHEPYTTCDNRFNRWHKKGTWDRLLTAKV